MDVAHRAGDLPGRQVEDPRGQRRIEIALPSRLDLRVPALRDERRQPADLELAADDDQQIGAIQLDDEARLRFDEMRILIATRERFDGDLVAADLADDATRGPASW